MNNFRTAIGIVLLIAAVGLFFYIEEVKDIKRGFFGSTLESITQMCNAGWGDAFNMTFQCMKVQAFYYSPWICGFFGIIFLAKAGPYRSYHGYGGAGSHNKVRMRPRTRKRIIKVVVIGAVIGFGIFAYANYEITVADQKIDDIIPSESIGRAIEDFSKNIPVKFEERK